MIMLKLHAIIRKLKKILIKYNKEHFRKVKRYSTYDDKTHEHTNDDLARDRIVKGETGREDCDKEDVY